MRTNSFIGSPRVAGLSGVRFLQRRALVHRDVIGLIALDFILWLFLARVVCVSFVIDVFVCTLMIVPLTRPASEYHVT